jgi:hypothetical protein
MITAHNAKTKLPTSLARPSQRASVAAQVKLMIHRCTDAVTETVAGRRNSQLGGRRADTLAASAHSFFLARIEATIKTHRSNVRASV